MMHSYKRNIFFPQVQLQNLMTSKYIEHFLEEVSAWQNKLSIADQVITLWLVTVG